MHNFKKLEFWDKSICLVKDVYLVTSQFPKVEQFGLISQMQRAAVSVSANIAEGSARGTNKDFSRFLRISLGSICELETLTVIAKELQYIDNEVFNKLEKQIQVIKRMIKSFQSQLKNV